jgi:hypothetical protein
MKLCWETTALPSKTRLFASSAGSLAQALENQQPDFPTVRDNLGRRLGITGRGAGELRQKFVRLGIVKPTTPYKANVAAARYSWTA